MPEPRASLSSIQTLSARGEDTSTHAHTSQLRDIVELSLLILFQGHIEAVRIIFHTNIERGTDANSQKAEQMPALMPKITSRAGRIPILKCVS